MSNIIHLHVGSYSVIGQPTISVGFINRVLSASSSPVAGTGQAIFDLGKKYNIDPVFAMAFFEHESSLYIAAVENAVDQWRSGVV